MKSSRGGGKGRGRPPTVVKLPAKRDRKGGRTEPNAVESTVRAAPSVESAGVGSRTKAVSEQSLRVGVMIKALRDEKGWKQRELAQRSGLTQQNIASYEAGARKRPKFLPEIARALGVSVDYILGVEPRDVAVDASRSEGRVGGMIPIIGSAAAGSWKEPIFFDEETKVPRAHHPRWGDAEQYALRLEGQSLNKRIPDGSLAIATPYFKARQTLKEGDLVHAVLRRGGGHLEEWSAKFVRIKPGVIELHPDSTDTRFKPYVFDERKMRQIDDQDVTLEVRGLIFAVQLALA